MKLLFCLLGFLLILCGIAAALYCGLYLCFVLGLINVIEACKNPEGIDAIKVAWNIGRMMLTGICGWLGAICFFIPGAGLVGAAMKPKFKF